MFEILWTVWHQNHISDYLSMFKNFGDNSGYNMWMWTFYICYSKVEEISDEYYASRKIFLLFCIFVVILIMVLKTS